MTGHTPRNLLGDWRTDYDFMVNGDLGWFIIIRDPTKIPHDIWADRSEINVCWKTCSDKLYSGANPRQAWDIIEGLLEGHT